LRDAAADIRQRQPTGKLSGLLAKNEEGVGIVVAHVTIVTAHALTKRRLRQVITRPGRLPRLQKGTAG
jgi:hypothetical protein